MKTMLLCRLTLVLAFGLALGIGSSADADVVGAWLFQEGSGSSISDSSGNGLTGTVRGNPQWQAPDAGKFGSALRFAEGDCIDFGPPTPPAFLVEQDISFMVWCKPHQVVTHWQVLFSMQRGSSGGETYAMTYGSNDDQLRAIINTTGGNAEPTDPQPFVWNEWIHAAATYDGDRIVLYRNGEPVAENAANVSGALNHGDGTGRFAINGNYNSLNGGLSEYAVCTLDEVVIFDETLSQEQIRKIMALGFLGWRSGPGGAKDPTPKDDATDVPFDAALSWTAGEFAATHDVYLGTAFEDVNAADRAAPMSVLVSQGQSDTAYVPAGPLAFGQTYFWRIDEVNAAPDNTIFKGKVWSFTAEPYAYPIQKVTATASSAQAGMGPENTINGSGLKDDEHSTDLMQMWMSAPGQPHWIQYEFDAIYKLDELWVWNSNAPMEAFTGFGAKDVTIEHSTDGAAWTTLEGVPQFAQATGVPTYTANTTVDLGGVMAKFVKLTINSNWGTAAPTSLSEVRFFHVPVSARAPQPAAEAKSVAVDSVLRWRPGREAVAHRVCLGTDRQAVIDGAAPVQVVTDSSFAPGLLDYGKTYYWKVDEVNEAATPSAWAGDVWSFSTADYAVIDDFESYTNASPSRLFQAWIDGLGFSEDEFFPKGNAGNDTGAMVGHDPMQGDIAEKTIVKSGTQSMPLFYDNTGAATSEAQYTFAAQDWTAGGIQSLSLYFCGDPGNAGQLYVKINNAKVPYPGGAADIKSKQWQPWHIDLSTAGASLDSVTKLTIGIEGAGATGVLYLDDIRLYPRTPEFLVPADPGKTGLLAEYLFDDAANDSSGNGHHGTFLDNAHVANSVLVLDGINDAVAIPRLGGAAATFQQCTYSMWMYSVSSLASAGPIGGINLDNWSAGGIHCKLFNGKANAGINGLAGGDLNGTTVVGVEEWTHLALTVSDTVATIYLNGQAEASRTFTAPLTMVLGSGSIGAWSTNGDIQRELNGQMDDVGVYNRALSAEEILWLAGKKDPVYKPF